MLPELVEEEGYSKLDFGSEVDRGDEEKDTALLYRKGRLNNNDFYHDKNYL